MAVVYCITFVGLLCQIARVIMRDGAVRWLWHTQAGSGERLGMLPCKRHGKDKNLIAQLQLKPTLK